jgi:2-dehydropantoate 2-reductase
MSDDQVTNAIGESFSPNKIAVIGAGPVGCVVAAALSSAGHEVILCDLVKELLGPAMDPGIRIEGALQFTGRVAQTVTSLDALADDLPELIIVSSKATALPLIASAMESIHRPGTYVVSWQNGLDTERVLADHLGAEWVMRVATNFGATLLAPAHVNVGFHQPPHWLQETHESGRQVAEAVCELLNAAGLPTEHSECLVNQIWKKTILNAAMSSVCAVTGRTMAQTMRDPFLRELVDKLIKEGIKVARANEIHLGWDYYRYAINYVKGAGDHKPSMLVDIEKGRITEAEYINGQIAIYAEIAGLEAPYNIMMRALVKALESGQPGK